MDGCRNSCVLFWQTMTIYSAELPGLEKSEGVLEQSYIADSIALKNIPLIDIDAVKNGDFVLKKGKVIKTAY
jgi:imidazolonepropionase-like amidohydrolase